MAALSEINFAETLTQSLEDYLATLPQKPLYEPVSYILSLGGKRIRPQLTLMSAKAFGGKVEEAMPLALAVEMFHNFSLVHDDIMDNAPLRRGKTTVHEKWNSNTAILSGDAMLILVYDLVLKAPHSITADAIEIVNRVSLEVCEGQMDDMEFEQRNNVSIEEYVEMIRQKTAVLLGGALELGALVAGADKKQQEDIRNFGIHLGIAFQLKDDLLDSFGESAAVGKQIGGDILANKKTYLYLKALEKANDIQKKELLKWFNTGSENAAEKIKSVKEIFLNLGIDTSTQEQVDYYSKLAISNLLACNLPDEHNAIFLQLTENLLNRTY